MFTSDISDPNDASLSSVPHGYSRSHSLSSCFSGSQLAGLLNNAMLSGLGSLSGLHLIHPSYSSVFTFMVSPLLVCQLVAEHCLLIERDLESETDDFKPASCHLLQFYIAGHLGRMEFQDR